MLNIILTILAIVAFYSIILSIGKIVDKLREVKSKELNYFKLSNINSKLFMLFGILLFFGLFFFYFYLEYARMPISASNFGQEIDDLFFTTSVITFIIFTICHIALFAFVYLFRAKKNRKATFFSHSTTLELIWTSVPALTMTILVAMGLSTWFKIFPNSKTMDANRMEIEATGKQFSWIIRYPGKDGKFGQRVMSKKFISSDNELGIDWNDPASHDDLIVSEIHMIKGKYTYFNLGALDVLHSFYLPHFRFKLDCVPGMPTGFGFTPTKSSEDIRKILKNNKYWASINPETGKPRYTDWNFELACAELCGRSHYGMQMNVFVDDEKQFKKWLRKQKPYFETNKVKLSKYITNNSIENNTPVELNIDEISKNGIDTSLKYSTEDIIFESNSHELTSESKVFLDKLVLVLEKNKSNSLILSAHTDSDGDEISNKDLSNKRANSCKNYLLKKGIIESRIKASGFGESMPLVENNSIENKRKNRRTEIDFN